MAAVDRSSRPEVFCKKDVVKIFAKFTGKHLCQRLCFPVNFAKFLRTYFFYSNSGAYFWVDLFASRLSSQIIKYFFCKPDSQSLATGAL